MYIYLNFEDNFDDNLVFLYSYWSKTMERGKEQHVSKRVKVVTKWLYKYHFSLQNYGNNCDLQKLPL